MSTPITGITEEDIADYLNHTPGFFERHAELLSSVHLTSPHGNRAISLQERQMEMMRSKVKGLEMKLMEMIRHGQENMTIATHLHDWTLDVLRAKDVDTIPQILVDGLIHRFFVPQAALRVWGPQGSSLPYPDRAFAAPVSADVRSFATSLSTPYCGLNAGFEATQWLDNPETITSTAMLPLRHSPQASAFGLLVLASPDSTRFSADMGTEFLSRIAELASASLARVVDPSYAASHV